MSSGQHQIHDPEFQPSGPIESRAFSPEISEKPTDREIAIKTLDGLTHLVFNPLRTALPHLVIKDKNFTLTDKDGGSWTFRPRKFTDSGLLYTTDITYSETLLPPNQEDEVERKALFNVTRFEHGNPIISSSSELYGLNEAERFLHDRIQILFQTLKDERPELRPDENPMA